VRRALKQNEKNRGSFLQVKFVNCLFVQVKQTVFRISRGGFARKGTSKRADQVKSGIVRRGIVEGGGSEGDRARPRNSLVGNGKKRNRKQLIKGCTGCQVGRDEKKAQVVFLVFPAFFLGITRDIEGEKVHRKRPVRLG